ncbi:hypothetical protein H6P81_010492 [Aristolochia fimbriata]|uniref:Aminotransferase-like plant mobile domain-containing protein n=1 Tax=Aristolochia fimbriata TaxID=158543 RepID=A0AAV7ES88_ARIFI|nr:hypothetical protein H6P81_010492 [Aristolochia fimbriata]
MTTVDNICVVIVSNPVITNGLVKPRLLAVQRVLVWGLGIGNVVMADTLLLYDQDSHSSEAIWDGETLRHWPVDERMLPYFEAAGFGALYRGQWLRLDKPLITALVERWRSETNTFHLTNGEMTITLEDVALLFGLCRRRCCDRVDSGGLDGVGQGLSRGRASTWKGRFSLCPDDVPEEEIHQHALAYLLHLVGSTIFSNGSARGVHMAYLTLFEDFEVAGRYSWGAATVAFLYRELAKACRTRVVGIAGCLTLMQLWVWERLHTGRPRLLEERVMWNVRRTNATNPGGNLVLYWTELDHQRSYQVKWQSYLDFLQHLSAICFEGRRIWLSRTPLICFEIVELHVTPPEDVEHVTRISRKGRAGEDWVVYHRDYIAQWEAQAESVVTGSRAHTPKHASSDYMMWYLGVTRRFVSPPPTEPAMVYHPRSYTEEALLSCVWNVVERVNSTEVFDPSSVNPSVLEIRHYCQSVLQSLPLLEGAIVDRDVSHAGEPSHVVEPTRDRAPRGRRARRRPTAEMMIRVEDSDKVSAVPEPMVSNLPPK